MRITDSEQNISRILDVYKNRFRPGNPHVGQRHSDCFVFVLTGQAEYIFDEKSCFIQPGDIIYLAHNSQYSIRVTDENYTYFYVDFYFENLDRTVFKNEIFSVKGRMAMEKCFEKLYNLWKRGDFANRIYCKALLYQIYSEIAKKQLSQYVSADCRRCIEQAAEYIMDHLEESELGIGALSQRCGISEGHFRRTFARIYHTSPVKYITALRVKKAKELLCSEDCLIAEIAERCGFQNHYYFSKVFKTETGMTPGGFRKFYAAKH